MSKTQGGVAAEQGPYYVPNLDRGLSILELLSEHPEGLRLSDIATVLDISRNSVFRITATLLARGYLARGRKDKRFTATRKILDLCCTVASDKSLVERAWDHLVEYRNFSEETVAIMILGNRHGIALEEAPGIHAFHFRIEQGGKINLHSAAPGKAMLAFLPDAERERMLKVMSFERFNDNTITDVDEFRSALTKIREQGWAPDVEEELDGCHCVAAPILNGRGYPVAAIWTTGPSNRLTLDRFDALGKKAVEIAGKISKSMGY